MGPEGLALTPESGQIVDAVAIAARGMNVSPAEIALAWVRDRPGVIAPIVGVRTSAQLNAALASEDLELPEELTQALNDVSD
jgi:aryl-alcohol dehydrogenase-like predicted oxidoreductase